MPTPASIPSRDLADFTRLGIEFGLLSPAAVVRWADGKILAEEAPAPWVIELSLAPLDRREMIARLPEVPAEAISPLAVNLFFALLRREWDQVRLTVDQVRRIVSKLHGAGAIPGTSGEADWGAVVLAECEEMDAGWLSDGDLCRSIDEKLAPYREYEPLLPDWA